MDLPNNKSSSLSAKDTSSSPLLGGGSTAVPATSSSSQQAADSSQQLSGGGNNNSTSKKPATTTTSGDTTTTTTTTDTKRVGHYEIGRLIGQGPSSRVRIGMDVVTKEPVAAKIIEKATGLINPEISDSLRKDIAARKYLKHPYIIGLREVMQTPRNVYVISELVVGGDLFDRLVATNATRFPEDVARKYFQQLIVAIRFIHTHSMAHKNLKIENLLLDREGNLKIAELGLANLGIRYAPEASGVGVGAVIGNPNFAAPEIVLQKGYSANVSDIWSCGCILYLMLCGHHAFDDPNPKVLWKKIAKGHYHMSTLFSDGAKDLIRRILVVEPARRISLNEIVAHNWFQVGFDPAELERGTFLSAAAVASGKPSFFAGSTDVMGEAASAVVDAEAERKAECLAKGDDAFVIARKLMLASLVSNPKVEVIAQQAAQAAGEGSSDSFSPTAALRYVLLRLSQEEACSTVSTALSQMMPHFTKPKPGSAEKQNELRGFAHAKNGLLTFLVTINQSVVPGISMAEIKKGRGDFFDFMEFVSAIISAVGQSRVASTEVVMRGAGAAASSAPAAVAQ